LSFFNTFHAEVPRPLAAAELPRPLAATELAAADA